jgi:hypothetical protein
MLKRSEENINILEILLDNKEYRKYALSQDEIELICSCCEILEPFMYIAETLSGEKYCSLNAVTPSICLLFNKTHINPNDAEFVKVFKGLLYNRLEFYNQKYELLDDKELTTACFTNPKTKNFPHATTEEKKDLRIVAIREISKYFEENKDHFQSQLVNNDNKKKPEKPSSSSPLAKKFNIYVSEDEGKIDDQITNEMVTKEINK